MTVSALADWAEARRALARQATSSVVGIERSRGGRFSGIVWNADTVVTAAEALQGAESARVHTADVQIEAEIIARDLSVDIAVLKARTGAAGSPVTQPTGLQAGDDVVIAGRNRSVPVVVWSTAQQIGPAWRSQSGGELPRLIVLSAGMDPVLEGGGVFGLGGHLEAMAVPGPRRQTLGIPVETIAQIVATVLQHGRLPQPYLGVRLQPVRLDDALRTALSRTSPQATLVIGVEPESPAAEAGLLLGDLLLSVADQDIHSPLDLKVALSRVPLGSSVPVHLHRSGAHQEITVIIRERARG